MNHVQNIVNSHALKTFFSVNLIEQSAGNITLGLSARDGESGRNQHGALGCIVDCAARLAGYTALGQCFISEYELSVHSLPRAQDFIVSAKISVSKQEYAIYSCKIYTDKKQDNFLLAESHGTLLRDEINQAAAEIF